MHKSHFKDIPGKESKKLTNKKGTPNIIAFLKSQHSVVFFVCICYKIALCLFSLFTTNLFDIRAGVFVSAVLALQKVNIWLN